MIKVYFDDVLIDTDSYTQLDNEYKLFADNFKLGSTASNSFYLSVVKSAVSSHPSEVRIEDDTTTWNFIVDDITANDNVYTYVLVEKLVDFNFDYDASFLINEKAENGEDCYLSDIWHDMCLQANVEYDETYVFENDIVVTWYDSRVQARKYLSFIAELQSGYACILENGKQSFKKQNRSSIKTIDADECSDLIVGEKKKITRVVFDGGAFKWAFGDETGDTLYLQKDNVFIVNEGIVENIYNNIKDFEFYTLDVPQAPMDSTIRAGDIITFDDNGTLYPTIAQYKMSYAGGWVGGYQLKVNTKKQQETQVTRTAENVKNLKVDVDRLNNEFSIVVEEVKSLTDYIRNVGSVGSYLKITDTPKSNGSINKLSIKGFELMPLYPGMTYPSQYTYPGVLNFYTLIFDIVDTFDNNPHYVYVNSPVPLQKLGSVHDELLIEQNKAKVIQRIGYDFANEQWSVLTNPITHELNDVLLPTFEGDTYVSVKYFDNLIFNAEYIIKNDLTSIFSTQLESESQYKQTQDNINLMVRKDNLISEINLSSEKTKIKSPRIDLNGYISNEEGSFEITEDGQAKFREVEIYGTNLYLPDGGRVVGGDGILTNLQFTNDSLLTYFGSTISHDVTGSDNIIADDHINVYIPPNFTIIEAKITFINFPMAWGLEYDPNFVWGYVRNLKLYKETSDKIFYYGIYNSGFSGLSDERVYQEIPEAFGVDGYTPSVPTSSTYKKEVALSGDIKKYLKVGHTQLRLKPKEPPIATPNYWTNVENCGKETSMGYAILNVLGYMKS